MLVLLLNFSLILILYCIYPSSFAIVSFPFATPYNHDSLVSSFITFNYFYDKNNGISDICNIQFIVTYISLPLRLKLFSLNTFYFFQTIVIDTEGVTSAT